MSRMKKENGWLLYVKNEKQFKKIKKNWYFNEMWYKIDNLMWNVLKIKYVKKKKKKKKEVLMI